MQRDDRCAAGDRTCPQLTASAFDILPRHHNFITLLSACELTIRPIKGGIDQKIRISGGLMHVKADQVTIFLDI